MTNEVNTARIVRAAATVPEVCMHNVKLGQGCFCPQCPTASFQPAAEPAGKLCHDGHEPITYYGEDCPICREERLDALMPEEPRA